MEPEDAIEVVSSEEGNVPAAPSEPTPTATPAEPTEPVQPAEPTKEPELFELPDGRKVDAATLTKEWKENFLPDYTRKSQALAAKPEPITNNEPAKNPLEDPNYAPQTYEELAAQIEARTLAKIEAKEKAVTEAQQAREDTVVNQLAEVKKIDPSVNETQLFLHATKYKFQDLSLAHQNMKDMADLAKKVQQTTATNIAKRNDPVSVSPGASGSRPDPSQFSSAREYLRSLNN